jgi:biotin carboxyl carrier protein
VDAIRRKRQKAALYRRRRLQFILAFAGACVFLIVVVVVAVAASRNSSQLTPEQMLAGGTKSPTAPVSASSEQRPAFARFGDRNILLPVSAAEATIIAYQPVSDTRAVALTPVGQRVNVNSFVRFFRGLFSGTPSVRYYQLPGADNDPTTSVLIGAQPDTPVTSPVSGVVVRVREYLLFGKYEDVQIDIRPEEMGGTLITLLFINDPAVTPGTRVEAGKTLLGKVRRCPEEIGKILAEYTHDSGSHVHLQVSEEPIR